MTSSSAFCPCRGGSRNPAIANQWPRPWAPNTPSPRRPPIAARPITEADPGPEEPLIGPRSSPRPSAGPPAEVPVDDRRVRGYRRSVGPKKTRGRKNRERAGRRRPKRRPNLLAKKKRRPMPDCPRPSDFSSRAPPRPEAPSFQHPGRCRQERAETGPAPLPRRDATFFSSHRTPGRIGCCRGNSGNRKRTEPGPTYFASVSVPRALQRLHPIASFQAGDPGLTHGWPRHGRRVPSGRASFVFTVDPPTRRWNLWRTPSTDPPAPAPATMPTSTPRPKMPGRSPHTKESIRRSGDVRPAAD